MNFLSHSIVLPETSTELARVGSALPDLWPLMAVPPLPALVLRDLLASQDDRCRQLAAGISHHMRADAVFHGHPEFQRRMDWLAAQFKATWPELRRTSFYAHVLVEMLLDRWLIQRDPRPLADYYAAFHETNLGFAAEHAVTDRSSGPSLRAVLDRFVSSRFLEAYATPAGLAQRFQWLASRLPMKGGWQNQWTGELAEHLEAWHNELAPGSGALLQSVRVAVDARGSKSNELPIRAASRR
jgi:hypothetical protein